MKKTAIVSFCTSLTTTHGGINSFNADLCEALDRNTSSSGLLLLQVVTSNELEPPRDSAIQRQSEDDFIELERRLIANAIEEIIWLGHDIHTGQHATGAQDHFKAGRIALFVHSDPLSYEAYKSAGASEQTHEKRHTLEDLAKASTWVFPIGPKLTVTANEIVLQNEGTAKVVELIPGLADIKSAASPSHFRAFFAGRFTANVAPLKQLELALRAFGAAVKTGGLGNDPALCLFGVEPSQRLSIKQRLADYAGRPVNIIQVPFTTDRNALFETLRKSSCAMLLSLHEGFGLTAWESISAEVPLILAKNSGVFETLQRIGGHAKGCVTALELVGALEGASDVDVDALRHALVELKNNIGEAKKDATRLRQTALELGLTWDGLAACVLQEIVPDLAPQLSNSVPKIGIVQTVARQDESNSEAQDARKPAEPPSLKSATVPSRDEIRSAIEAKEWERAATQLEMAGLFEDARSCWYQSIKSQQAIPNKLVLFEGRRLGLGGTQALNLARTSRAPETRNVRVASYLSNPVDAAILAQTYLDSVQIELINRVGTLGSVITKSTNPVIDPIGFYRTIELTHDRTSREIEKSLSAKMLALRLSPRVRSEKEIAPESTFAVADTFIALTQRRLGAEGSAEATLANALLSLDLDDPVFSMIAGWSQLPYNRQWWLPIVTDHNVRTELLDSLDRYKVTRLVEFDTLINPLLPMNAIWEFWAGERKETTSPNPSNSPLVRSVLRYAEACAGGSVEKSHAAFESAFATLLDSQTSLGSIKEIHAIGLMRRLLKLQGHETIQAWDDAVASTVATTGSWYLQPLAWKSVPADFQWRRAIVGEYALLRACIVASHINLAASDQAMAEGILLDLFRITTDSFNTNTHYCLMVVDAICGLAQIHQDRWLLSAISGAR